MWRSCKSIFDRPSICIWVQLRFYSEAIIGGHKLNNLYTFIVFFPWSNWRPFVLSVNYVICVSWRGLYPDSMDLLIRSDISWTLETWTTWVCRSLPRARNIFVAVEMPSFFSKSPVLSCMAGVLLWDQGGLQWFQQCCHRPTDDGHCILCFFGSVFSPPKKNHGPGAVRVGVFDGYMFTAFQEKDDQVPKSLKMSETLCA